MIHIVRVSRRTCTAIDHASASARHDNGVLAPGIRFRDIVRDYVSYVRRLVWVQIVGPVSASLA